MQVIATALGYDGIQLRQVNEQFEMPDDVFEVNNSNHAKTLERCRRMEAAGRDVTWPSDKPPELWFRRANKEEVEHKKGEAEVLPPVGSAAAAARNARLAAARIASTSRVSPSTDEDDLV